MPLQVLLTVDTEFWPRSPDWPSSRLPRPWLECELDYERGILGRTSDGDFGLPYLLETLMRYDLHAVFFVESLFASAFGLPLLERTVDAIVAAGQDVQLHVHTEWLGETAAADLPGRFCQNLSDLNVESQTAVIARALSNLRSTAAAGVIAMRAGNMGGNFDTLTAAKNVGLELDFSFDPSLGLDAQTALLEAHRRRGSACMSIPLSCVRTLSGRLRHAQLGALSAREMEYALRAASQEDWNCFVILLHSFELVIRPPHNSRAPHVDTINLARWHRLCKFLSENRDRFTTVGCNELKREQSLPRFATARPIDTLMRMGEQLYSRLR